MILNTRHVGIVVTDLERMKTFYSSLGFVKDSSDIEEGTFIDGLAEGEFKTFVDSIRFSEDGKKN